MIDINNISYTYGDGTKALMNVSMKLPKENIFAVMGMSGSGKTTLLNCLARFLKPQAGTILLNGEDIYSLEEKKFRSNLGVVFQNLNLFPHLTVLDNLTLAPCRVQNYVKKDAENAAREMLERLGISELISDYPGQISGGQAQRVAIARSLMLKPQFMLLDEPTSALDARTTEEFAAWLLELKCDTTFVIVTHDTPFAERVAQHGVFMEKGRVTQTGRINDIVKHIKDACSISM